MQNPPEVDTEENEMAFLNANRYELEENAVFLSYDRADLLNNLTTYKSLNIYTRTALAKNIASIEELCCKEIAYTHFLNCLAEDCEEIQTELIHFLQKSFTKPKVGVEYHREYINPLITLIKGTHLEIKEGSCDLLSQVVHRLSSDERKDVMRLAQQLEKGSDEQGKIIAIQLIARLTADLSQQQAQKYFKNDYINLYNSSTVRVKKEIIYNLSQISHHVSSAFFDRQILAKFFMERCREHIWGIRKVCVEILAELIAITQTKKDVLANLLFNFTMDGNKLVKIAAYKIIPEFLAKYGGKNPSEQLLRVYLNLMDNQINQYVNRQDEILEKVAFFFPGVLHTYGAEKWNQFRGLFSRLLHSKKDEIKLPIASSLHQICKILGHEIAKQYMFQALDSVLKQNSERIKTSAISHLSDFVEVFTPHTRQNLIDVFLVIQNDNKKWRVRYQIARQLKHLTRIYETEIVFRYIFPIGLKLVSDSVSEVRFEAASHMYQIIDKFNDNDEYENMALLSIKSLCTSERHLQRLAFAYLIRFLHPLRLFSQLITPTLGELSHDRAVIVREALAISIKHIIQTNPSSAAQFSRLIQTFLQDEAPISQLFV